MYLYKFTAITLCNTFSWGRKPVKSLFFRSQLTRKVSSLTKKENDLFTNCIRLFFFGETLALISNWNEGPLTLLKFDLHFSMKKVWINPLSLTEVKHKISFFGLKFKKKWKSERKKRKKYFKPTIIHRKDQEFYFFTMNLFFFEFIEMNACGFSNEKINRRWRINKIKMQNCGQSVLFGRLR